MSKQNMNKQDTGKKDSGLERKVSDECCRQRRSCPAGILAGTGQRKPPLCNRVRHTPGASSAIVPGIRKSTGTRALRHG